MYQKSLVMYWKTNKMPALLLAALISFFISCESDEVNPAPPVNNAGANNNSGNSNTDNTNDGGNSTIQGCQYPGAELTEDLTLEQGSFKVLGNALPAYSIFGYSFSVAFEGTINELGIKVPEKGTYTVRIYPADLFTHDILAEVDITVDDQDWKYVAIDPLEIAPDQSYIACLYIPSKPDEQEAFFYHINDFGYPQTSGDVTIEGYASNIDNDKVKPEPKDPTSFVLFNGLVDLCFEAK